MKEGYDISKPVKIKDIQPLEYKVLIKLDDVDDQSAGGIYLPDSALDREKYAAERGVIISMSGNAFVDEFVYVEKPVVGDRVLFAKYSGMLLEELEGREKVKYRLMNDKDICAILR